MMTVIVGMVLLVGGVAAVVAAMPLTQQLARVMPQWAFSRGDVERLGSTTFLVAFIGLLSALAGVALLLFTIVQS
jgi:hypothetical protein